jgi:hypothetical protein
MTPFRTLALVLLLLVAGATASMAQQLGNYTNMMRDREHGTQIEYLTTNGKAFLWYPGNDVILEGRWKREGSEMCFRYGENTYNPATGQQGGGWECMPFDIYWWVVEERMPGDIFGLATRGAAPFKLDPKRTTLEKLLARVSPGAQAPAIEMAVTDGSGAEVSMSCASILANAERDKVGMAEAVSTYFHGRFMGKFCVEVDYDKAYDLARRAGISFEPWANTLRERAAAGHPSAKSAVERLGL